MNSLIFQTTARTLMPLLVLFSFIVLMVGHNEPGGGFVGGLVAAGAVAMYSMAFGPEDARKLLRGIGLHTVIGTGLAIALGSILFAMVVTGTLMEGVWLKLPVPLGGLEKISTVMFFDIGVYITVFGVVLLILLELQESRR